MKKNRFLFGMLAVMLVFGSVLIACDDGSGGKPALLAGNATADQALAKLDEIIAYSGSTAQIIYSAENLKSSIELAKDYDEWDTVKTQTISAINLMIRSIP
jgi:hypothetical protein